MARKIEQEYRVKDSGSKQVRTATSKVNKSLQGVEKVSGRVTKNITSAWKGLAAVVVGAFAFSEILRGFKSITKAASDLQEVTSKFETVFGDQFQIASQYVDELTDSYYLSTRAAREYLASTQDLLVPMGVAADEAANLSGEVVKLAADLGSFNNLQTGKVMADIQSALVGNFETMKKYGVVLNEARVKQKAFDMGLTASVKEALDPATKAMAAYQLVVEGSTAAIGDSIRTSGSYANVLKRFEATVEDLSGAMGEALLPYLADVLQGMTDWIKANETIITQKFKDVVDGVAAAVKFLAENMDLLLIALGGIAAVKIGAMLVSIVGGITTATAVTAGMTAASTTLTAQIAALTTVLSSYNAQWGIFTAQATAATASTAALGTTARTASVGVSALGASLATLGIYAGAIALIYLGFKLWKGRTDELNESLKKTDEIMKGIESTSNKILLQDKIKSAYNELDRLMKSRADAQKELNDIIKNPDGSISTMKIGGGKQYENLHKINTKINELMGVIGDAQYRLDQLTSGDAGGSKDKVDPKIETDRLAAELKARAVLYEKEYAEKVLNEHTEMMNAIIAKEKEQYEWEQNMRAQAVIDEKNAAEESLRASIEADNAEIAAEKAKFAEMQRAGEAFTDFLATRFTDSFMAFLDGTKSAQEAFREMAVSILRDLAAMIIKMAIFNAMQGAMGGYGGALASAGTFFGMANGGHTSGKRPVLVGEKGPEIFKPDGAGTILNNSATNRAMSGGGGGDNVSFTVNINRPVGSDGEAKRTGKLIQNEMRAFFDKRLAYQSKPGGILRPQPVMR